MEQEEPKLGVPQSQKGRKHSKKTDWLKICIWTNIAVVVIAIFFAAGSYVLHLSNTSL